jgi:PqqD family protein of HPr-rel-A system
MKWQINFPQSLHMKTWGDEAVVFDAQSGSTHLLGADAARIFATIMRAPMDTADLLQYLTAPAFDPSLDIVPADNAAERLDTILAELAGISLISTVAH